MTVYLGKAVDVYSGTGGGSGGDAVWGSITGTLSDQTDLQNALNAKQDTLTAGSGIDITNNVISATGGGSISYDNSTINENASNQLQAIGVVDKNTSHDSGSLHYMPLWEGTQQQYETGGQVMFYDWTYNGFGFDNSTTAQDSYFSCGCYGNGKYLLVNENDLSISYSSDGETWSAFPANTLPFAVNSMAYGAGKFVAVGDNGAVYSVDDGENWTQIQGISSNVIIYGTVNGTSAFFTFDVNEEKIKMSSDGETWTDLNSFDFATLFPNAGGITDMCIAWGELWVLAISGIYAICKDLSTWNTYTVEADSYNWYKMAYNANANSVTFLNFDGRIGYVDVGGAGISDAEAVDNDAFNVLMSDGSKFIAVSANGKIRKSTNGRNWSEIGNLDAYDWWVGFYGNGKFIVGGIERIAYSGNNVLMHAYTESATPTRNSTVYSSPNEDSASDSVFWYYPADNTIVLSSDRKTICTRNSAGDILGTTSVGKAHPEYLCFIDSGVVKRGNGTIVSSGISNTAATGSDALTILGIPTIASEAINIGIYSRANGLDGVAIGSRATAGEDSIAIGTQATATAQDSIAIGKQAGCSGANSIQIGQGLNNENNTLKVGFGDSDGQGGYISYKLLDNSGLIPVGRLAAFTGADGMYGGTKGAVPAPTAADNDKFLRGDGTWASGVQLTSNLVTSVSSSSTDSQYPSAKCVYDIVGDIETLLYNLNSGS